MEIDFTVAPLTDIPRVLRLAMEAVQTTEGLDDATKALFGVSKLSGTGLEISGRVWVPTKQFFHFKYSIVANLSHLLQQAGVAVAMPAQEVHLQQL